MAFFDVFWYWFKTFILPIFTNKVNKNSLQKFEIRIGCSCVVKEICNVKIRTSKAKEVGSINCKDTFFYAFFLIIHRMFFCALTDFGHWQNLAMHEDRWLSLRTLWLFHEWHPQKWIKWLWTGMLYKVILYKSRVEPFLWNRIWDLGWF